MDSMTEIEKLMGLFYVAKFNRDEDNYIRDSINISFLNAKRIIDKKRKDDGLTEFRIIAVLDY